MAIANSYPVGTPKAADLLLGTSVPNPGTDEKATTKNFSVSELGPIVNGGYTSYVAALLQTGAAAPVPTILQNNTGGTFTWSKVNTGQFRITISGITLAANKVVIFENATGDLNLGGKIISTTVIDIDQFSSGGGGYADGMLAGTSIEIRIYA